MWWLDIGIIDAIWSFFKTIVGAIAEIISPRRITRAERRRGERPRPRLWAIAIGVVFYSATLVFLLAVCGILATGDLVPDPGEVGPVVRWLAVLPFMAGYLAASRLANLPLLLGGLVGLGPAIIAQATMGEHGILAGVGADTPLLWWTLAGMLGGTIAWARSLTP